MIILAKYLLCLVIGLCVCSALFGLAMLLSFVFSQKSFLSNFLLPIATIVPMVIFFLITKKIHFFIRADSQRYVSISLIIAITSALCASLISNYKRQPTKRNPSQVIVYCLSGMAMELPQRLFMQSLLFVLLRAMKLPCPQIICYILNALVWCLGILAQAIITKQKFSLDLFSDILASFVYSIGIGMVFSWSGLIIIPMLSHCFERLFSAVFQNIED